MRLWSVGVTDSAFARSGSLTGGGFRVYGKIEATHQPAWMASSQKFEQVLEAGRPYVDTGINELGGGRVRVVLTKLAR